MLSNYSNGNPGARATKVLEAALGDTAFPSPRLAGHASTGSQPGQRPLEDTVPASLARLICGDYYSAELGAHYTISSTPASTSAKCRGEEEAFLSIAHPRKGSMLFRAVQWRWSTQAEGAEHSPPGIDGIEFLISSKQGDLG